MRFGRDWALPGCWACWLASCRSCARGWSWQRLGVRGRQACTGRTVAGNTISFANLDWQAAAAVTCTTAGASVDKAGRGSPIDPAAGPGLLGHCERRTRSPIANLNGSGGGDLNTAGAAVGGPEAIAIDPATGPDLLGKRRRQHDLLREPQPQWRRQPQKCRAWK